LTFTGVSLTKSIKAFFAAIIGSKPGRLYSLEMAIAVCIATVSTGYRFTTADISGEGLSLKTSIYLKRFAVTATRKSMALGTLPPTK
jgi:hypothetical protein